MYKVYYWLTLLLFLLMFVMAAWFVCLVAVNTTGETLAAHGRITQPLYFPTWCTDWGGDGKIAWALKVCRDMLTLGHTCQ